LWFEHPDETFFTAQVKTDVTKISQLNTSIRNKIINQEINKSVSYRVGRQDGWPTH